MKELLFCYKRNRKLLIRHTVLTDVFVPVEDIISPQKTTLIIPKTDKVELSDIIIIRDNNTNIVDPFYQYAPELIFYKDGEVSDMIDCSTLKSKKDIIKELKERSVISD